MNQGYSETQKTYYEDETQEDAIDVDELFSPEEQDDLFNKKQVPGLHLPDD
jgi:hypothetical protein